MMAFALRFRRAVRAKTRGLSVLPCLLRVVGFRCRRFLAMAGRVAKQLL